MWWEVVERAKSADIVIRISPVRSRTCRMSRYSFMVNLWRSTDKIPTQVLGKTFRSQSDVYPAKQPISA